MIALRSSSPMEALPARRVSRWLVRGFGLYLRPYLRRHFHAVAISGHAPPRITAETPLLVYANHASWWDPLIALLIAERLFPDRALHAPIDAWALRRYPLLARLGFFGVETRTLRGAATFVRTAKAILSQPGASVWLTPEGRFVDPRDHSAALQPGLAHLAASLERGVIVPLALEYPFWEERLPEALVRLGEPFAIESHPGRSKEAWQSALCERLRQTQQALAEASLARRNDPFEVILQGRGGVGGVYDVIRRLTRSDRNSPRRGFHSDKLGKSP